MYRYPKRRRFDFKMKPSRLRPIILLLLFGVIVFFLARMTTGASLNEANFIAQRNARIRSEMQHAVSHANSLSRLGAPSTSSGLSRVRQHVHGIEVINDLNVSMYGEVGRLYEQSVFDKVYSILDAYDANLFAGHKVNNSLAQLSDAINGLNDLTIYTVLAQ